MRAVARLTPGIRAMVLSLAWLAPASACEVLAPFSLAYAVSRGDTGVGEARIALEPAAVQGCYTLRQVATPALILRWITGTARQESEFCLRDGRLRSQRFVQHRSGLGAGSENYQLTFDWSAGQVEGSAFGSQPLREQDSDQLLLQIRVRDWLCRQGAADTVPRETIVTPFIDRDGQNSYEFAVTGQETIQVPAGEFTTLRVDRIDAKDRQTTFWLAPARDFSVIQAVQKKSEDPAIRLQLLPESASDGE